MKKWAVEENKTRKKKKSNEKEGALNQSKRIKIIKKCKGAQQQARREDM